MAIIGFVLGTILGSFAKAIADRSLNKRSFWGRSYCPKCKHTLAWYDLLPIASYILLKGKCRYCHKKLGLEYVLVEVGLGLLVGFLFWQLFKNFQFSNNYQLSIFLLDLIFKVFFIVALVIVTLTDFKKMLIPDRVIVPSIRIALGYVVAVTLLKIGYLYYYLNQTVLGRLLLPPHSDFFQIHALLASQSLFGSLAMALLIGVFFMALIVVTKGRGMGGGDVKLGAFMGFGLGFPGALVALMLAFLSGALVSIILIIFGKKHFGQSVPFGPFLVLGSLIALFWGNEIINWYQHLSL